MERERERRERRDSRLSPVGADKPKRQTEFNKARQGKVFFFVFQSSSSPGFGDSSRRHGSNGRCSNGRRGI